MDRAPFAKVSPLLHPEELAALEAIGQAADRPRGHTYIAEGDEDTNFALLIQKGHVKVVTGEPPRLIAFRGSGEFVGELNCLLGVPRRNATVVAVTEVQALLLPGAAFRDFVENHTNVLLAIVKVLAERHYELQARYIETDLEIEQRFAKVLIYLIDQQIGEQVHNGVVLPFGFRELASYVGLNSLDSIKKVARALKALEILRVGRTELTILDVPALRDIADGWRTSF